MGKTPFLSSSSEALFQSRSVITARPLVCAGLKKRTNARRWQREPMAMQPAIARQNRRGVWLYKRLPHLRFLRRK